MEFTVTCLHSADHCDWMQSQWFSRMAIETGDLSMSGLMDVVSSIIEVWPLIVSLLKETVEEDSDDSYVVWHFP